MPLAYWLITGPLTIKQNCRADLKLSVLSEKNSLVAFLFFQVPFECVFRTFPMASRTSCLHPGHLACTPSAFLSFLAPVHPSASSSLLSCPPSCGSPLCPPSQQPAFLAASKEDSNICSLLPFPLQHGIRILHRNQNWRGRGKHSTLQFPRSPGL